jgi:hypothetical protein
MTVRSRGADVRTMTIAYTAFMVGGLALCLIAGLLQR